MRVMPLLFALVLCLPLQADEQVARLIARLDNPSWKVREASQQKLIALGPQALPQVRAASDRKSVSVEARHRLQQVLARLEITADAASLGLGGLLKADRRELRPGQRLTLTMALLNQTRQELIVGRALGQGELIELAGLLRVGGKELKYKGHYGCGTGLPTRVTRLGPGELRRVVYVLSAHPSKKPGHVLLKLTRRSTFGAAPFELDVPAGKLRIDYLLEGDQDSFDRVKGDWAGKLTRSTTVVIGPAQGK